MEAFEAEICEFHDGQVILEGKVTIHTIRNAIIITIKNSFEYGELPHSPLPAKSPRLNDIFDYVKKKNLSCLSIKKLF
jgi:hypothetical protein